jgi:solute carrier family 25 ornithine transporter 2/15
LSKGAIRTIICGGVGGVSLWIAIFPFDVIKSRVQISNTSEPMLKMLVSIARTEGNISSASKSGEIHLF